MSRNKPSVDLGYPRPAGGRIPAFNSIEEEAAFWDTQSVTEFVAVELQLLMTAVSPEITERITVRRDEADRSKLARRVRAKGIGPSTLARMRLKERSQQEDDAEASAREFAQPKRSIDCTRSA